MDRVKVIPFSVMTTVIATIAMITVPVNAADSGGLARNCRLNEVKGNPKNPSTFFWCLSDGPVLMKCVSSKIFDAAVGKCVTPMEPHQLLNSDRHKPLISKLVNFQNHKGSAKSNSSTSTSPAAPSKATSAEKVLSSAATGADGSSPVVVTSKAAPVCSKPHNVPEYHVYEGNCEKFWQCSNGVAVSHNCPGGLDFNPAKNVCDWPSNAQCTWGAKRVNVGLLPNWRSPHPSAKKTIL